MLVCFFLNKLRKYKKNFSIDKNNYGLTKFWKWSIRFDRIGKILNKKINDLSWYETPVKAPVIETDKKNTEYEFVPGGGY